jgi:hypothetical protein
MPGLGKRFQPGNPGRTRGTLNRASREIRDIARGLLEDPVYQRKLRLRLLAGTAGQVETLLHYYAYGKPQDSLAVTGTMQTVDYESARASLQAKLTAMLMALPVDSPVDAAETTPATASAPTIPASRSLQVQSPTAASGVEVLSADEPTAPAPPDPPTIPASSPVPSDQGGLVDDDGTLSLTERIAAVRQERVRLWRTRR